jgi:hypothetical protein
VAPKAKEGPHEGPLSILGHSASRHPLAAALVATTVFARTILATTVVIAAEEQALYALVAHAPYLLPGRSSVVS